jgi:hypothetical protein
VQRLLLRERRRFVRVHLWSGERGKRKERRGLAEEREREGRDGEGRREVGSEGRRCLVLTWFNIPSTKETIVSSGDDDWNTRGGDSGRGRGGGSAVVAAVVVDWGISWGRIINDRSSSRRGRIDRERDGVRISSNGERRLRRQSWFDWLKQRRESEGKERSGSEEVKGCGGEESGCNEEEEKHKSRKKAGREREGGEGGGECKRKRRDWREECAVPQQEPWIWQLVHELDKTTELVL